MSSWFVFALLRRHHLHYLAIDNVGASHDSQDNKNYQKDAPGSKKIVQQSAYKKTKKNAPGHREAQLHYKREIFRPSPAVFYIKQQPSWLLLLLLQHILINS